MQFPWRAVQTPEPAVVPPAEQVTDGGPELEKLYPFAQVAKRNSPIDSQIDAGQMTPISFTSVDEQYPSIAAYQKICSKIKYLPRAISGDKGEIRLFLP